MGSGRQIATGSYEDRDWSFGQEARTRQGILSQSDRDRCLCRDGLEHAAYRAVTFSGSEPEFEREKGRAWDCVSTCYSLTQGALKIKNKLYSA
ncbi:hypothetical protein Taro_052523 [Colocasia esculenta]|uniref:Uncharacterized protein n=1 Tax=Colocasia esculenta TaxID=4460 RepID=A0A843XKH0_COLES|nr:hypothetical protein [Colocasia esculenta]